MKGKYLYGVIGKTKNTSDGDPKGLSCKELLRGGGIATVDFRRLSAVVAEAEVKDYHKLPKEETVRELVSHQQTIEKIMEHSPILPVKFGTILKDEEEVTAVLEKGYFFLRKTLRKFEDKIELDLVCFWNDQKAAQMAFQESKKVKNFYKKITSEGKTPRTVARQRPRLLRGEGIEDKITLGKLVADYLASKKEKISLQVLKALKKETVESCSHALADVNMLLNRAFLVEKKRQRAFNHALNILDSKFAGLLNFRLVGPLPPYSFATLLVDSLDKKEVAKARETLKLNGQLSSKRLKQTYDKLAMRLHPDKGGNPLEFEIATSAYKLLRNFMQNGLIAVSVYKWEER